MKLFEASCPHQGSDLVQRWQDDVNRSRHGEEDEEPDIEQEEKDALEARLDFWSASGSFLLQTSHHEQ